MRVRGMVRVGRRTKDLVKRLRGGEIAVIEHEAIDGVAAQSLLTCRVRAVVNAAASLSERYPNRGPMMLLDAGVPVLDRCGSWALGLQDGDVAELVGNDLFLSGRLAGSGLRLTPALVERHQSAVQGRRHEELAAFLDNTLTFAAKERALVTTPLPQLASLDLKGRHVLVVVRGPHFRADLRAIRGYIRELRPVLIGVDGGADALRGEGFAPDMIVGDMDSVTDRTLRCGAELVVHAYRNGEAPGLKRIRRLGLKARTVSAPGTSEDVAMLLAYEAGAELIVAVGSHSSMEDFLEKGRPGMASTVLTRMKIGARLVDAKGVSLLYRERIPPLYWLGFGMSAVSALVVCALAAPVSRTFGRLLWMKARLALGL